MHGILFKYLKEYVETEYGEDAWEAAMDAAGIEPKLYLPVTEYPEEEAVQLVGGVAEVTDADEDELLEAYGERLAPELLDTFSAHVRGDWNFFDLLEHPDNQVFDVFHSDSGDASEFTTTREGDDAVIVHYASALEMCELAVGALRGIAAAYDEDVTVSEDACMHRGADRCEITVARR